MMNKSQNIREKFINIINLFQIADLYIYDFTKNRVI